MSRQVSNDSETKAVATLRQWSDKITLQQGLVFLVCVALLLVAIGYFQYWSSDYRKYDLARPGSGEETQATDLTIIEDNIASPVGLDDIERKQQFLEDEQSALGSIHRLETDSLSNKNIHLSTPEQPGL